MAILHQTSFVRGEGAQSSIPSLIPTRPKKANRSGHITGQKNEWVHPETPIPFYRLGPLMNRVTELENIIGKKPEDWTKPTYGQLDYTIAHRMGWISDEEEGADKKAYQIRRKRSLQTCHRYTHKFDALPENPIEMTGDQYTPQTSADILNDNRLTDGAKVLALKLMEETYRKNRAGRWLKITVTYLMKALQKSRRTIQNYLRLLEHLGYIRTDVITSPISRMCVGLAIWLQQPMFPKHHIEKWPEKRTKSGVQQDSYNDLNKIYSYLIPIHLWTRDCMEGIYKSFRRNIEPYIPPKIQI